MAHRSLDAQATTLQSEIARLFAAGNKTKLRRMEALDVVARMHGSRNAQAHGTEPVAAVVDEDGFASKITPGNDWELDEGPLTAGTIAALRRAHDAIIGNFDRDMAGGIPTRRTAERAVLLMQAALGRPETSACVGRNSPVLWSLFVQAHVRLAHGNDAMMILRMAWSNAVEIPSQELAVLIGSDPARTTTPGNLPVRAWDVKPERGRWEAIADAERLRTDCMAAFETAIQAGTAPGEAAFLSLLGVYAGERVGAIARLTDIEPTSGIIQEELLDIVRERHGKDAAATAKTYIEARMSRLHEQEDQTVLRQPPAPMAPATPVPARGPLQTIVARLARCEESEGPSTQVGWAYMDRGTAGQPRTVGVHAYAPTAVIALTLATIDGNMSKAVRLTGYDVGDRYFEAIDATVVEDPKA